ncbi:MAG TPA: hypothetical protein PLP19_05710 [bacterium]|nr:hypothetical protein [bacterium]HPN42963.1 hypothetical protein [bacterium]
MNYKRLLIIFLALFAWQSCLWASSPFKIKGTLPWHNFLSGPTAWNEGDYQAYLDDMQALGMNFIGFHCYTGGAERYAPYVEPMIRIEYRNVVPLTGFDTSITARWGYRPLEIKDFAFNTGKLFSSGLTAYGADCAIQAQTNEQRYQLAQQLMRRVLALAHERGIKFAMGFEFGIHPPEFASIVPPDSWIRGANLPDPTHASSIEILHNTIDNILTAYPGIDYIWLWLHEHTMFVGRPQMSGAFKECYDKNAAFFADATNPDAAFTGVWSLEYIKNAYSYIKQQAPQVQVIIGGWGGGNQLPVVLRGLDKVLPNDIIFSCLNPNQGEEPQIQVLAEIAKNRRVWAIPWLEGDARLWHLQPRVSILREQVHLAVKQNLDGVLAIHWRTRETRTNMKAFAQFSTNPDNMPTVEDFYKQVCREENGIQAERQLSPLLAQMDRERRLDQPESPEYWPYNPQWGCIEADLVARLENLHLVVQQCKSSASTNELDNLNWLDANIQFTLLLDKVSRRLAPAYRLKERWLTENPAPHNIRDDVQQARLEFDSAPVEALFNTFQGRELSRGELGVLSAVNQKLWLQYIELDHFLHELD